MYRGPFRHAAGAPTPLVIAGTHDPATPYGWAKRYVADLGNARLLTYRCDGHGALTDLNPCVGVGVRSRYIEAGALPPEGATCTQSMPASGRRRAPSGVGPRRGSGRRAAGRTPQAPVVSVAAVSAPAS